MSPLGPPIALDIPPAADPALGVFETLLIREGRPVELDRHMSRLAASTRTLYRADLDPELGERLRRAASDHRYARLRVDAVPQALGPAAITIALSTLDPAEVSPAEETTLVTVAVPGGAGAHKLADRRWLAQVEAACDPGTRPLLVARSGALLESTRANVFVLRDGTLATPPLDGTILPGVTRSVVLEQAGRLGIDSLVCRLSLEDLHGADVVLLSGSLALLERVTVRGGRRSERAAARLAHALAAAAGA